MIFAEESAIRNAMNLIYNLNEIDNEKFVDKIVNCVIDNDEFTLEQMLLVDEVTDDDPKCKATRIKWLESEVENNE